MHTKTQVLANSEESKFQSQSSFSCHIPYLQLMLLTPLGYYFQYRTNCNLSSFKLLQLSYPSLSSFLTHVPDPILEPESDNFLVQGTFTWIKFPFSCVFFFFFSRQIDFQSQNSGLRAKEAAKMYTQRDSNREASTSVNLSFHGPISWDVLDCFGKKKGSYHIAGNQSHHGFTGLKKSHHLTC